MFFFFPFNTESQSSSSAKTLPLLPFLPAPASARTNPRRTERACDIGDFAVDFLRQTIVAFTSSLTALGNAANALFAQTTAVLATDRVARDAVRLPQWKLVQFRGTKKSNVAVRSLPADARPDVIFSLLDARLQPHGLQSMGRLLRRHELLGKHVDACCAAA